MPRLAKEHLPHHWWTIDLCIQPAPWAGTERCKTALDELDRKYG